jgi:hypothetical protein
MPLQYSGVPSRPSTKVDEWSGLPTLSCSGITMNDLCPRSLCRPADIYLHWSTPYLHHQQAMAFGASSVIGNRKGASPTSLATGYSRVNSYSFTGCATLPPPGDPSPDDWFDDHRQKSDLSERVPNDSTQKITFSQEDSRDQEWPTYEPGFYGSRKC